MIIRKKGGITTGGVDFLNDKGHVGWFTIDGRKLNGQPREKGFFIQNGKKTVRIMSK